MGKPPSKTSSSRVVLLVEHSTKNTFSFADDYDDDGDDNNGARTLLRQDDRLCRRGNRVHKGFLVAELHSMEYSLVIDSDWQQSFPRHMLHLAPWRYLNRWQIFNC